MVNVKKVITSRDNDTVIAELRKAGYDKITLYYAPHPKHKDSGLLPEQMLVTAWRYKPRPDKQGKKIGEP
jgi:hypothetical protein